MEFSGTNQVQNASTAVSREIYTLREVKTVEQVWWEAVFFPSPCALKSPRSDTDDDADRDSCVKKSEVSDPMMGWLWEDGRR